MSYDTVTEVNKISVDLCSRSTQSLTGQIWDATFWLFSPLLLDLSSCCCCHHLCCCSTLLRLSGWRIHSCKLKWHGVGLQTDGCL